MVKEMRDHEGARPAHLAAGRTRIPDHRIAQPIGGDCLRPVENELVALATARAERCPALEINCRIAAADGGLLAPGEAAEPDLVAPEDVVEGAVDRLEEGAAIELARLVGQALCRRHQAAVLPGIVASHGLDESGIDHGGLLVR